MTTTKNDKLIAQNIRDAFGPCTVMFECRGIDEICAEARKQGGWSAYVKTMLDVESVYADRDNTYAEWKAMRPLIVTRLQALGCKVE